MDNPAMNKASEWSARASDKLSSLKGRFGGSRKKNQGYDDGYDEYGYNDDYDDGYYGEDYDAYQETYGEFAYDDDDSAAGPVRSRSTSGSGHPPLVSIDDVRANTQVPDRLRRDPLPNRDDGASRYGSSATASATSRDRASDATASYKPAPRNATSTGRSPGYNSLFDSTSETAPAASTSTTPAATTAFRTANGSPYDPYAAYEGVGSVTHSPTRNLKVLSPLSYGEVESVARSLKAGDVVVLSLRRTPSELSKRVLDFSFGVASALDASVDCVADKVFVIARGTALTSDERIRLQGQGIL